MKRLTFTLISTILLLFGTTRMQAQISTFPYVQNFDTWSNCTSYCYYYYPCYAPGSSNWTIENLGYGNEHWIIYSGNFGFYSYYSHLTADHTSGSGKYVAMTAYYGCYNQTGNMLTPEFNFTANTAPVLEFWSHMYCIYSGYMGYIHLDVSFNNGSSWTNDIIPAIHDNDDQWNLNSVDLSPTGLNYGGMSSVKFRFRGVSGTYYNRSDFAIDDFRVYQLWDYDAAASTSASEYTVIPVSQAEGALVGYATNIGLQPLSAVTIQADLTGVANGFVYSQTSAPVPLAVGASTSFALPGLGATLFGLLNPADTYTLTISVSTNPSDQSTSDNTSITTWVIDDTLYARDDDYPTFAYGIYGSNSAGGEIGNQFTVHNLAAVTKGNLTLGNPNSGGGASPIPGNPYAMGLWSFDNGTGFPDTMIAETPIAITPSATPGQEHSLEFAQPIIVTPGEYVMTIEEQVGSSNPAISKTANIYTPDKVWIRWDTNPYGNGDGWSHVTPLPSQFHGTPVVRMVFNDGCLVPIPGLDDTLCYGDTAILGGSPAVVLGTPPYTYSWAPAASLNDPTLANPMAYPTVTTQYTLTVTDAFGCSESDSVLVNVNPLPIVNQTGLGTDYCIDDSPVAIKGTPAGGVWTGPGSSDMSGPYTATYSSPVVPIADGSGSYNQEKLNVSGLPGSALGGDILLQSVCFQLNHTWIGDVVIRLVAPDGTVIELMDRPGNPASYYGCSGDNVDACVVPGIGNEMENVCGNAPAISGTFTAANGDDLGVLNNGVLNPNGQWKMEAADFVGGDGGAIASWTLTFVTGDGEFDPATAGAGVHTISYCFTDANGCVNCADELVEVHELPDASITPVGPLCLDEPAFNLVPATPLGTFSGPGITDPIAGVFNAGIAGVGTHTIHYMVTDLYGCYNEDSIDIVVNDVPTADAGLDFVMCEGSSVTIGGSPTGTPGVSTPLIISYTWVPAAGLSSPVAPNPLASPSVTTTYTVTVTDINGCTGTDMVTITVNANPVVDAGPDAGICSGSGVVVGGAPTATSGTPPYTYNWAPAGGLSSTTTANPTANPAGTTTYTVTVTDANGCTGTDMVMVTVSANPIANAGADYTMCSGDMVTIGGAPTGSSGTPPYTYSWAPAAGLSSATAANPDASPTATTTYTLTVSDAGGCTATDMVTVTVNPVPVATAGSDVALCAGSSVVIGGGPTGSAGTPPYTYSWAPASGLVSPTDANPTATPAATTNYTVTVTDVNGCTSTDEVVVTVNPNPIADAGSDKQVCNGSMVAIGGAPSANAGTAPYTYSWAPAAGLSSASIANPDATPAATTTYTLTVSDANGCSSSDAVIVTVIPGPTVSAGNDISICIGESTEIGGSPSAGGGAPAYAYNWNPMTDLDNAVAPNPTATPTTTTTYTLIVTDANGCTAQDEMTVTVNPLPVVSFSGLNPEYCVDDAMTLMVGVPTGGVYSGPGITGTAFNPALAGPGNHTITYTYTDANGCTNSTTMSTIVWALPVVSAGADVTVYLGHTTQFNGTSNPAATIWDWQPNDGSLDDNGISNPVATPLATTTYTLTVTDIHGCVNSDDMLTTIDPNTPLDAPNTYTPNGDGTNDTWIIPIIDFFPKNSMKVYNRWGQLVYEATDYSNGSAWDGGTLPAGTYFYIIKLDIQTGLVHRGPITIIR